MVPVGLDPAVVREWVARSCAEQAVEVLVRDPVVVARVAVLLGGEPSEVRRSRRPLGPRNQLEDPHPPVLSSGVSSDAGGVVVDNRAERGRQDNPAA